MSTGTLIEMENICLEREGARYRMVMCDWCGRKKPDYCAEVVYKSKRTPMENVHLCGNCKDDNVSFNILRYFWDGLTKKRDFVGQIWHQGLREKGQEKRSKTNATT